MTPEKQLLFMIPHGQALHGTHRTLLFYLSVMLLQFVLDRFIV